MRITIHRANQIGGCITIIEHNGCKIIIDLGSNLPGSCQEELSKDDIDTLTAGPMQYSILITMVTIQVCTIWSAPKYLNI